MGNGLSVMRIECLKTIDSEWYVNSLEDTCMMPLTQRELNEFDLVGLFENDTSDLAGFAVYEPYDTGIYVHQLRSVVPKRGYGAALLSYLGDVALRTGKSELNLDSPLDENLLSYYASQGFAKISEDSYFAQLRREL